MIHANQRQHSKETFCVNIMVEQAKISTLDMKIPNKFQNNFSHCCMGTSKPKECI